MTRRTRRLAYAALTAPALLLACAPAPERTTPMADMGASTSPPPSPDTTAYGEDVVRNLERVRAATMEFQDIAAAHAAGYPTTVPRCLENPPEGAMGLHYMHRELLDDQLDVEHPEILVYAPTSNGKPKLVGVEYVVPLSRWEHQRPPQIFGQSLKRSEPLGIWYLHVWSWEPNSKGLFADWNPAVKC